MLHLASPIRKNPHEEASPPATRRPDEGAPEVRVQTPEAPASAAPPANPVTQARKHPLRQILDYARRYRASQRKAMVFTVLNKSLDLAPPFLIALAINAVTGGHALGFLGVTSVTGQLLLLGALSIVIWGGESLFEYLYRVEWETFAQKLQHDLRLDVYDHVQRLEMRHLEDVSTGKVATILNEEIGEIEHFFEDGIAELVGLATTAVIATVAFVMIAPSLAWVTLVPIPIIVWFALRYEKRSKPLFDAKRGMVADLNGLLVGNVMGVANIRSFTAEEKELERVRRMSEQFMATSAPVIRINAAFTPIIRMAVLAGFAGTLVIGGMLVMSGNLTAGAYAFMVLLTQRVLWPLTTLGRTITSYQRSMTSVRRVLALLSAPVGPSGGVAPVPRGTTGSAVELRDVRFGYRPGKPVLDGFNLTFPAGEMTGIVGLTGTGKTTIARLLLRFYEPEDGQILIDGQDIRELDVSELRRSIGFVSQDVFLFEGTVFDNIAYGVRNATLDEVIAAARIAEVDTFIASLPEQYQTRIGERGVKLSGGQRQRICIARAVLKAPPILILDEATSSVDNETEAAIQRSLERISTGRTTIVIAHRLSTVRNARRIDVLGPGGRIVEQGRHDELIAKDGVYAALWRVQTGAR